MSSPLRPTSPSRGSGEPGSATDAQALLARVAVGDERAFEQLYDVIAASLFGLVHRIVRDAVQAEEVTREVLVEVWRTAPRYRPEHGCALTWVLTLAHHRAVDRVHSARATGSQAAHHRSHDCYPIGWFAGMSGSVRGVWWS